MRRVRMVRVEETSNGIIGVLTIDGLALCFTLQPDKNDRYFQIPPGSYLCKRFHGKKWKDTFEIIVKGHTALLFHIGNQESSTQGCVLLGKEVGEYNGERSVLSSRQAFSEFMDILKDEDQLNLTIIDCI